MQKLFVRSLRDARLSITPARNCRRRLRMAHAHHQTLTLFSQAQRIGRISSRGSQQSGNLITRSALTCGCGWTRSNVKSVESQGSDRSSYSVGPQQQEAQISMHESYPACLSVVIPAYNEEDTLSSVVSKVLELPYLLEVLIVDHCSTDGTKEVARQFPPRIHRYGSSPTTRTSGKTEALKTGFATTLIHDP